MRRRRDERFVVLGSTGSQGFSPGGMDGWIEAGLAVKATSQLSVRETQSLSADALILDVRNDTEWRAAHIPGARHVPLHQLSEHIHDLAKTQPIVMVCTSGYRSSIASSALRAARVHFYIKRARRQDCMDRATGRANNMSLTECGINFEAYGGQGITFQKPLEALWSLPILPSPNCGLKSDLDWPVRPIWQ